MAEPEFYLIWDVLMSEGPLSIYLWKRRKNLQNELSGTPFSVEFHLL